MPPFLKPKKTALLAGFSLLLIAAAAAAVFLIIDNNYLAATVSFIDTSLSTPLFLLLLLLLPAVGFPISIFLIAAAVKFSLSQVVILWVAVVFLHSLVGYGAATFFRPSLENIFQRFFNYSIPSVPPQKEAVFALLFLTFPGFSYAIKNYLLPLSGVSLRYCVFLNCAIQGILGIPFILLGHSGKQMDPKIFSLAAFAIGVVFLLLKWLKKKSQQKMDIFNH